jgi:type II secretory pathway pseudopilin PulG
MTMGLLDFGDSPQDAGLLSLGLRLMSTPGKFGTALGQAGLGAMGDYRQAQQMQEQRKLREQQAQEQALRQRMLEMQLAQAQQAQEQARAQAQARGSFLDSVDPSVGPAMPVSVPQAMRAGLALPEIQALMPAKAENPFGKIDPKDYTPESLRRFASTGDFTALQPVRKREFFEGRAVDPYDTPVGTVIPRQSNPVADLLVPGPGGRLVPNQPLISAKKEIGAASATRIDNGQRFENSYSTNQGKEFSEMMSGINKVAFAAPAQIRKLERMESLLDGVDGGKLAPTGLDIASAANAIGIKLDPKLGNKEAAQALAREIAGGFRQPGTGPMTDKDFENFLLQVPDLSKTAEGRKQITATMKAAANRDIQIAKMAREYARKNSSIDNDFLDLAAQYIAENPVVGAPKGWKVK